MSFRIRRKKVIHQTIDGEVVAIDLQTGSYFSLVGSAADIWAALARGVEPGGIATELVRSYEVGEAEAGEITARFLEELVREGLVERADDDPKAAAPGPGEPIGSRRPFQPPVLERHDDMQSLILLDPVHEVDEEKGWPAARPPGMP